MFVKKHIKKQLKKNGSIALLFEETHHRTTASFLTLRRIILYLSDIVFLRNQVCFAFKKIRSVASECFKAKRRVLLLALIAG